MLPLLEHKTSAAKRSQMAHFGLSTIPQLIRGLTYVSSEKNAVGDIAGRVHCLSPKPARSLVLIEHRPCHLNKRAVLAFHSAVLRGSIWRRNLMVQTMVTAEVVHTRVPELSSIIGTNSPDTAITLVVQPQDQIVNKTESFILRLKKEHPREPRKIIHHH